MKNNLLWPAMRWPDGYEAEIKTAGDDADCVFVKSPELVSDEQWSSCDAIISTADPCLLYTSPSPRDAHESRMPSSA